MTVTRRSNDIATQRQSQKAEKPEELFTELDASRRRSLFSLRNCGCLLLLMFLAGLFLLLSLVAATGLITIPVVSQIVYSKPPVPERVVEPVEGTLEALFATKVQSLAANGSTGEITLSEAELTRVLQEPMGDGNLILKQAQIAIDPTKAEVYGIVSQGEESRTLVARLTFTPSGQTLALSQVRIGYVTIPPALVDGILRALLTNGQSIQQLPLESLGIERLTLGSNAATVQLGAEAYKHLLGDADLGELMNVSALSGVSIGDVQSGGLTPAQYTAIESNLDELPTGLQQALRELVPAE